MFFRFAIPLLGLLAISSQVNATCSASDKCLRAMQVRKDEALGFCLRIYEHGYSPVSLPYFAENSCLGSRERIVQACECLSLGEPHGPGHYPPPHYPPPPPKKSCSKSPTHSSSTTTSSHPSTKVSSSTSTTKATTTAHPTSSKSCSTTTSKPTCSTSITKKVYSTFGSTTTFGCTTKPTTTAKASATSTTSKASSTTSKTSSTTSKVSSSTSTKCSGTSKTSSTTSHVSSTTSKVSTSTSTKCSSTTSKASSTTSKASSTTTKCSTTSPATTTTSAPVCTPTNIIINSNFEASSANISPWKTGGYATKGSEATYNISAVANTSPNYIIFGGPFANAHATLSQNLTLPTTRYDSYILSLYFRLGEHQGNGNCTLKSYLGDEEVDALVLSNLADEQLLHWRQQSVEVSTPEGDGRNITLRMDWSCEGSGFVFGDLLVDEVELSAVGGV